MRPVSRVVAKYLVNPVTRLGAGRFPGAILLETTGHRSGKPRHTPLGYYLDGKSVWIVSEHGPRADYVKNLRAHPRVRVRIRGRWLGGTAHYLPGENPEGHLRRQHNRLSAATVRLVGTDLRVVRIDLDPEPNQADGSGGSTSSTSAS